MIDIVILCAEINLLSTLNFLYYIQKNNRALLKKTNYPDTKK